MPEPSRFIPTVFLPVRKLAGPLHRRHRSFDTDPTDRLPALPPPWHDERWFRGGFPPREHSAVHPLVDGDAYFGDLVRQLRGATERVTICGWCLTPLMTVVRDQPGEEGVLAHVLNDVSSRAEVYVLLWKGAPALFDPTVRLVEKAREVLLTIAPRVHCVLDAAPFSHDHHQKAVTIDGRVAYVGGMDLSTFQGDRWDTNHHELRFGPNWHDTQVRLEGEVVRDVEENFCERWNATTHERLTPLPAPPRPELSTPAQIVRTVPRGFYGFAPHGEYGIYHALTTAIRKADRFVYLENQYIWAPEIVDALCDAITRDHSGPFRVVMVLPAKAYTGKYDNDEHVRALSKADGGRGIFHAYALYAGGPAIGSTGYRYEPIYVHSKVSIIDDEWFSVGSANLNRRGISTDTEMNVHSIAPDVARSLRIRLWAEHLGLPEHEVGDTDPISLIDNAWQHTAAEIAQRVRSAVKPIRGSICPYKPGHNIGSRILDLMQDVTLEH